MSLKKLIPASLCFFAFAFAAVAGEALTLKLGFVDPPTAVFAMGGEKIAEEVDKATGGKVKIEVFASALLGNERDMYEAAQIGAGEMFGIVNVVLSNFIPDLKVLDQPFLFDTTEEAHTVIEGELGELVNRQTAMQGVRILGWMDTGFRDVFSDRPIEKVEDFKGFKLRTMENQMQLVTFGALGANPTPMASSEQFTAMQQGAIDGAENAISIMYSNRFYEIIKHATLTHHQFTYVAICIAETAWNKIPEELRPAFQEGVTRGIKAQHQLLLDQNAKAIVDLQKEGVTIHEIDREEMKKVVLPAVAPAVAQFNQTWVKAINDTLAEMRAK